MQERGSVKKPSIIEQAIEIAHEKKLMGGNDNKFFVLCAALSWKDRAEVFVKLSKNNNLTDEYLMFLIVGNQLFIDILKEKDSLTEEDVNLKLADSKASDRDKAALILFVHNELTPEDLSILYPNDDKDIDILARNIIDLQKKSQLILETPSTASPVPATPSMSHTPPVREESDDTMVSKLRKTVDQFVNENLNNIITKKQYQTALASYNKKWHLSQHIDTDVLLTKLARHFKVHDTYLCTREEKAHLFAPLARNKVTRFFLGNKRDFAKCLEEAKLNHSMKKSK